MTTQIHDVQYLDLVKYVLKNGVYKEDRTGTGTFSVFSHMMKFDLSDGSIPLLTTKKMHTRSIIHEILWYLQGNSNIQYLTDNKVTIWNEWADANGDLGPVYGVQWRAWPKYKHTKISNLWGEGQHGQYVTVDESIDQIAEVIHQLKTNPNSRRLIVNSWNVAQLSEMALPPCHYSFQFWTSPLTRLERVVIEGSGKFDASEIELDAWGVPKYSVSCQINQRSCDVGLGVPFNIVQYSILLRMIAQVVNMVPGELSWVGTDIHIYSNHVDALREQVERVPFVSPTLKLNEAVTDIDHYKFEDFTIENYQSLPSIKMEVAV